jgi:hypothetical protein
VVLSASVIRVPNLMVSPCGTIGPRTLPLQEEGLALSDLHNAIQV